MSTQTGGNLNLHVPVVATDKIGNTLNELATDMQAISDADAQDVKLSGTQTVAGVKTFSSSPVVPTPTTDMQASTKKYVDDLTTVKVDKVTGKGLSTEDYTTAEKSKLSGIEASANNYTHPANHAATVVTEDSTHRFVTDTEKTTWNNKLDGAHTHDDRYFTETEISAKVDMTNGAIAGINTVKNAAGVVNIVGLTGITVASNDTTNTISITATGESTPGAHADSHATIGADPISASDIGAEPANSNIQTHVTSAHAPADANNYVHPISHDPSIITQDSSNRFVTDTEKSTWNGKAAGDHNHTGTYEPANSNIQTHVTSAHAPSTAQANADITKDEIEAKLTGEISSHSHAGSGGGTGTGLFEYNLIGGM
jgi:hypothetical protein